MTERVQHEVFEETSLAHLINLFLTETKNENTRRARRNDLTILDEFLERSLVDQGVQDRSPIPSDWTVINASAFLRERKFLDSANTYARRVANYRSFGRFVETACSDFESPMGIAGTPQRIEKIPHVLHQTEIDRLRQYAAAQIFKTSCCPACPYGRFQHFRTWMLFELMLYTGIRPSECLSLTYDQVDSLMLKLRDVPSPGYFLHDVPIASDIAGLFRAYLSARELYLRENCYGGPNDRVYWLSIPVFPSGYGARPAEPQSLAMTPKTIWRSLVGLGASAGVKRVSARILRHTFAVQKLAHSSSLRKTADALRLTHWRMGELRVRRRYLNHAQALLEKAS